MDELCKECINGTKVECKDHCLSWKKLHVIVLMEPKWNVKAVFENKP